MEGQPGAAAWVLDGMRGDWRVTSGVAGTAQLDAVHRVLGRPGGDPGRRGRALSALRGLLAQEKKKVARLVGDTPIYDIIVGDDEGQIPLRKLQHARHEAAAQPHRSRGQRPGPPDERDGRQPDAGARGPLPGGKQMSVSQRQVRRR